MGNTTFEIGKPIPDWDITAISNAGEALPDVKKFLGKPLIVLLFSLHCPGCIARAIPFANSIVYEHGNMIQVMGIHTRFEGPKVEKHELLEAKEKYNIRFPYYNDNGFAATFYTYQGGGTPHWVIVNPDGAVRDSIFGSDPNRALLRINYIIQEYKQNLTA